MILINDYITGILYQFREYLDEGHTLCDLKSVNFSQDNIPDYHDVHLQQYYLLRYAYAYAFEYKKIYETLLRRMQSDPLYDFSWQNVIRVHSIGCGTMLDYWALARVLEQAGRSETIIDYTGIDLVDWRDRMPARRWDRVTFRHRDVIEELSGYSSLDSDIFIFPKSISEFSDEAFAALCNLFQNKPISSDVFCILISLRSDPWSMARDYHRAQLLEQAVVRNSLGYGGQNDCPSFCLLDPLEPLAVENGALVEEPRSIYRADDGEQRIDWADPDFRYPAAVTDTLRQLHTRCASYQKEGASCSEDCAEQLTRWPILYQRHLRFLILPFARLFPF